MTDGDLPKSLQSHGQTSRVYVPILRAIFEAKYSPGDEFVDFSLDDIRAAALELNIVVKNAPDLVYRMRSRTVLPAEILALGFYILRQVGRGLYRLEKAESSIIDLPDTVPIEALDLTPLPVRRLLPESLHDVDEQALLAVMGYCKLLDHFTGLTVYRLRSHVRKSVAGVGQAELDELDVGVALSDEEIPIVIPIEAKAVADPVNRVQISVMAQFAAAYFPDHEVRPIAMKVDEKGLMHFLEFNVTETPSELVVARSACYRLMLSDAQRRAIAAATPVVL